MSYYCEECNDEFDKCPTCGSANIKEYSDCD